MKNEVWLGQKSIQVISSSEVSSLTAGNICRRNQLIFFVVQQCLHHVTGVKGENSN